MNTPDTSGSTKSLLLGRMRDNSYTHPLSLASPAKRRGTFECAIAGYKLVSRNLLSSRNPSREIFCTEKAPEVLSIFKFPLPWRERAGRGGLM